MTKRCRHEWVYCWGANEAGQTIRRFECTYQYALESVLARFTRPIAMITCRACELELSLGPSNDESDAVHLEMRAAVLEDTDHWGPLHVSIRERWGIEDHHRDDSSDGDEYVSTDEYLAGWLSSELESHDVSAIRDASAWAWDISRPIAAQLAETARVDADTYRQGAKAMIAFGLLANMTAGTPEHARACEQMSEWVSGKAAPTASIPEHPPDPACTCDATAPDAATAIALGWTLSDGKWRCPFWAADVGEVVA